MGKASLTPIFMLLVNVILGSVGQILIKLGATRLDSLRSSQGIASSLVDSFKGIFTPHIFLGFCLYAVSSVIWIRILRQVNLSFAYPMVSMSYVFVVILSSVYLNEKIPWTTAVGLVLICGGVSMIGMGHGAGR